MIALLIAIFAILVCAIWTFIRLPRQGDLGDGADEKNKLREFMVYDIRANTQSCGAYLALVGVVATIIASNRQDFAPMLNMPHLWPFGIALLAATLATIFFPAGYGQKHFRILRLVWLRSVLCEQIVVISTCYGIWIAYRALSGHLDPLDCGP
jgi:hypothetical protein